MDVRRQIAMIINEVTQKVGALERCGAGAGGVQEEGMIRERRCVRGDAGSPLLDSVSRACSVLSYPPVLELFPSAPEALWD